MDIRIDTINSLDRRMWDTYIRSHPESNIYQCSGWFRAIHAAYGYQTFFISAYRGHNRIAGVLPLVAMRGLSLRKVFISAPFCDMGGMVADGPDAEAALLEACLDLAESERVATIELRQPEPLDSLQSKPAQVELPVPRHQVESRKVRMLLPLPASSHTLFNAFKAKLRSQIRRPEKSGFSAVVGGRELLDDFYHVFVRNMRDLGSPVHARSLIEQVLIHFKGRSAIIMVYRGGKPAAASLIIGFQHILVNPWASALRDFARFSPNMLLYWTMLAYGCERGYSLFDFGRSTPGEGTHRFKKQWGAYEAPLAWYVMAKKNGETQARSDVKSGFSRAIEYWSRLPVGVTRVIGPKIRKHISL